MGDYINDQYAAALHTTTLDREQVASVLVDLKCRIQGDFYIIEESDDKIVLGNRACPFGDKVIGRPAMCMMTSNVFGAIAARNLGYAKVELQKTIAMNAPECRVVVYLRSTADSQRAEGREYFGPRDLIVAEDHSPLHRKRLGRLLTKALQRCVPATENRALSENS